MSHLFSITTWCICLFGQLDLKLKMKGILQFFRLQKHVADSIDFTALENQEIKKS